MLVFNNKIDLILRFLGRKMQNIRFVIYKSIVLTVVANELKFSTLV